MRRLAGLVVYTVAVFGSLVPLSTSPAAATRPKPEDQRYGRLSGLTGRYVCEQGPLAGQVFASRKALLTALRQDMSPREVQRVPGGSPVRKLGKIKAVSR